MRSHVSKRLQDKWQKKIGIENPPTVSWLLEHREERHEGTALTKGYEPIASLYCMYEYLVTGNTLNLGKEVYYFFNHETWIISEIPDPKDPDPERYAILAVLLHYLVVSFNQVMIEQGWHRNCEPEESDPIVLEEVPSWVRNVPRLKQTLVIPGDTGEVPIEDSRSAPFLNMNIVAGEPGVSLCWESEE